MKRKEKNGESFVVEKMGEILLKLMFWVDNKTYIEFDKVRYRNYSVSLR